MEAMLQWYDSTIQDGAAGPGRKGKVEGSGVGPLLFHHFARNGWVESAVLAPGHSMDDGAKLRTRLSHLSLRQCNLKISRNCVLICCLCGKVRLCYIITNG